jgi:FlaG/FlaF family flagellin (archaellin)
MLALVDVVTVPAVAVKVVLVLPAGTVTLAGTVATAVLPLVRVTTAPPVGAAPLKVTVPVDVAPETTVDGFNVTDDTVGVGTID